MQTHIVVKGDTLWKISRNYGVSFEELKKVNAHLANPEYIVPGMKIFIPNSNSKKMESTTHPYSDNRPVKKEMVKNEMKKEEVKISEHNKANMHPVPPAMPIQPAQPIHQMPQQPKQHQMPQQPKQQPKQQQKPQPPPQQPMQPPASYTFPIHMMPVPDIDMTPSPQGWRLMESTSIHIHNHIQNFDIEVEKTPESQPTPQPVQPTPIQPTPQLTSPIAQEASPAFEQSPTFPTMYPCPPFQQFPYMHQQADYGGFPCVQICYVPVYPCPPYPYPHY